MKLSIRRDQLKFQPIIRVLEMHLKSSSKLVRSELRLDLGQQQGALLRRSHSHRLPLASLSTNTLRCGPQGGAVLGGAARSKGSENCVFTDDDGTVLDVWSVIKPGHVREKIALFGHDNDKNVKGSWDVTAKRRRRASQIPPLPQCPVVAVTLQPAPLAPPSDLAVPLSSDIISGGENDPKLSVVEMVAFLEQRVTCSPHAKLRSSASITLSRAPPSQPALAAPSDPRPIAADEPESVSVSDMVAKLERRSQNERRTVGRVLLAEQQHPHPLVLHQSISSSEALKTPPPPTNKITSHISICKQNAKINASFVTEMKVLKALATPTSTERSDAIGRGRKDPLLPTSQMKESKSVPVLQICKLEKTLATNKTNLNVFQKQEVNSAILTLSVRSDIITNAKSSAEVESPKCVQVVERESLLKVPKRSSTNADKTLSHEEPLPGLLFLTPPLKPCVQSEQRTPISPIPMPINSDTPPEERDNADSFIVTVQSQTRTQHSPSPGPTSFSSSSIAPGQSQKRKRQPCDPTIQSEESKQQDSKPQRTFEQLQNGVSSLSQWEKRKSCPVQSESRAELLPTESQPQRRRLNRIAQSEKRRSCPIPALSNWSNSQEETRKSQRLPVSDSLELLSRDYSQSESGSFMPRPLTGPDQSESRTSGSVLLRSSSDVGVDRRRRRKAARAFSLCAAEGARRFCEGPVRAASEDFLLMRRRLQSLLEPRTEISYLSLLPHHLLVHILSLLPTRALAALKCSCRYLRLIIDTYDPRPLDALWVCDPRYRDDPCKQCKRRHQRGDVSLCRWHHKPFCQAMPYGPGYWMCCHGDRRDAPGCNVGLHDNRWVPAFHSINAPIYRQWLRDDERESQD